MQRNRTNSTLMGSGEVSVNNLDDSLSSISPVKESRDNSMSQSTSQNSTSSDYGEPNVSLYLKHNIHAVQLGDPATQQIALRYLLEKVRDLETLMIESAKSNQTLQNEVTALYKQNDALAADNVTLQETITELGEKYTDLYDKNNDLYNELIYLKEVCVSERDKFVNVIASNAKRMTEDVQRLEEDVDYLGEFIPSASKLADSINEFHEDVTRIDKEIVRLDKEVTVTNQYNRRENLVIDGIPDNVPQGQLEKVCLDIVHSIGFVNVSSYEVIGCHRLRKREGDSTTPTIIRFFNRKITEFCLKNRRRLKNLRTSWNLSFREDLCDTNKAILEKCENLKEEGLLAKVYTHNGFVKIAKSINERPFKVSHMSDISNFLCRD